MNIAYIMRGVPGSGKSTLAKQLVNGNGVIHSTDDYFCSGGMYRFEANKLREYHDKNFEAFCASLKAGVPVVVCDNTNTMHWHFDRYVEAAQQAGYLVALVVLPHPSVEIARSRTTHSVPIEAILKMIAEWEN